MERIENLERVRDLAAEGQIQVVLAYSPDRLSRKYAYQILLMEELARQGVKPHCSQRLCAFACLGTT